MLVLPYRAKNPPPSPPYCTYGLILANVLTYVVTSDRLLHVQHAVLESLAFSHSNFEPIRLLTAMFLHGDPLHLIGNMLFLWIFGAAVEGRLGPVKFLALYFLTGAFGDVVQNYTVGRLHPHMWNLGASGAIMGVAGAYLFMFPFATIRVFWTYNIRFQVTDWNAQYVILYFLALDVLDGVLYQGLDGVAHLVHVSAAVLGFFLPMLLGAHRDSEQTSAAQAMRVDAGGDLSILALHEIEALIESNPKDPRLRMLFIHKAVKRADAHGPERCVEMLIEAGDLVIDATDPGELALIALLLPKEPLTLPNRFWMRLASRLEIAGREDNAVNCYENVLNADRSGPDAEMAFMKLARLVERTAPESGRAAGLYAEQLGRFPHGPQAPFAQNALRRLGVAQPQSVVPSGPIPRRVPEPPPVVQITAEASQVREVEDDPSGLKALVPRNGDTSPPPAQQAMEPGYNVGDTAGMSLRPMAPRTPS